MKISLFTGGIFDMLMIGGVILLNGYIGFVSEAHADAVIHSIGKIEARQLQVRRDGLAEHTCGGSQERGKG